MTTILEKRDDIIKNIEQYIDENNVRCEKTSFKNDLFISIDFEREEKCKNGITYVFPKMKEDATSKDIATALVERFIRDNKGLGFKPSQLISMEEKFHKPLLIEAVSAFTLGNDMRTIVQKSHFDIMRFGEIYNKSGDTTEIYNNGNLLFDGFKAVLLGSVDSEKHVNIPSMLAIAEKMGSEEGKALMKAELGEYKQEKINSILPKLKDVSLKNKAKIQ